MAGAIFEWVVPADPKVSLWVSEVLPDEMRQKITRTGSLIWGREVFWGKQVHIRQHIGGHRGGDNCLLG